jgi:hypothetical protein
MTPCAQGMRAVTLPKRGVLGAVDRRGRKRH